MWHQELKKQESGTGRLKELPTTNKTVSESWLGGRFWTAIRISDGMLQSACQDMISETLKGRLQKYFDLLHLGLSKHLLFKIFQINDSKMSFVAMTYVWCLLAIYKCSTNGSRVAFW